MQVTLVTDSPVHCTNGKGGTLRRIALDPRTRTVGYIEVHRGRIFTHDHCVPAGRIREATTAAVTLTLSTQELEDLGAIEAKNPATGLYQRCIPETHISLAKTRIEDPTGQVVGHCYGVETGPTLQVEFLLTGSAAGNRIPITDVTTLSEDRILIEPRTSPPQETQPTPTSDVHPSTPAPTAATSPAGGSSTTAQQVLRFLQQHPGEAFVPADLCEHLDCVPAQVRTALERLVEDGQISRQTTSSGTTAYHYTRR